MRPKNLDLQDEFMTWLIDPGRVGTQAEWARSHGVTEATLSNWKRSPDFKRELERKLAEINVNPIRIQKVVDAMWDKAAQGDTKAAELYLRYIEKLQPQRPVLEDDTDVSKLSDQELLNLLTSAANTLGGKRA